MVMVDGDVGGGGGFFRFRCSVVDAFAKKGKSESSSVRANRRR